MTVSQSGAGSINRNNRYFSGWPLKYFEEDYPPVNGLPLQVPNIRLVSRKALLRFFYWFKIERLQVSWGTTIAIVSERNVYGPPKRRQQLIWDTWQKVRLFGRNMFSDLSVWRNVFRYQTKYLSFHLLQNLMRPVKHIDAKRFSPSDFMFELLRVKEELTVCSFVF